MNTDTGHDGGLGSGGNACVRRTSRGATSRRFDPFPSAFMRAVYFRFAANRPLRDRQLRADESEVGAGGAQRVDLFLQWPGVGEED